MSRRASAALAAVVLAFASPLARADETAAKGRQWVPTASLGFGSLQERLRGRVDGTDSDSYRGQARMIFALGLAHPVARFTDDRLWIDGHASLGAGLTFQSGHWHLPLREDVTVAWAATHWLVLRGGLGAGLTLDATESSRSFAELALPLGFTLFDTIELVYRPMLTVPLGKETSTVFGGTSELSTRLAVVPFELLIRVRVGALAW